jgi:hypothetical protein
MSLIFAVALVLPSCGIEGGGGGGGSHMGSVSSGSVSGTLNDSVSVDLPVPVEWNFSHFSIYYRIYISGMSLSGQIQTSNEALGQINNFLVGDYAFFSHYTNTTDAAYQGHIGSKSIFNSKGYYEIALEGANIEDVLNQSQGQTFTLDFLTADGIPKLKTNGVQYNLWRSNGDGAFNTLPADRYFRNHADLNTNANVTPNQNKDVAVNNSATTPCYTYVSVYIMAVGFHHGDFTDIYSKPTFLSILKIP